MSGLLLTTLKRKVKSLELIPDAGGCFEVTLNGELLYSKLATDEFPNEATLVAEVRAKLG